MHRRPVVPLAGAVFVLTAIACSSSSSSSPPAVTQTTLLSSIRTPASPSEARANGYDYDGDGLPDNHAQDLANALGAFGFGVDNYLAGTQGVGQHSLAFDLTAKSFQSDAAARLQAYYASIFGGGPPVFDGLDILVADTTNVATFTQAPISAGALTASGGTLYFSYFNFLGSLGVMKLEHMRVVNGTVDAVTNSAGLIVSGALAAVVRADDFGASLNDLARTFNQNMGNYCGMRCSVSADCSGCPNAANTCTETDGLGGATGSCVPSSSNELNTILSFDANKNGFLDVSYDPVARRYLSNELAPFFNTSNGLATGTFGANFTLGLDADGTKSMGLGFPMTGVKAKRH